MARKGTPRRLDSMSCFGSHAPSLAATLAWRLCGLHSRFASRFGAPLGIGSHALWKTLGSYYPGPFDKSVKGMKLRIYPTENYGERVIALHGVLPEKREFGLVAPYLMAGGRFVDIGANIGLYAIYASRRLGRNGRVLAVEPHPVTARKLDYNRAANGCDNVAVVRCALGARAGEGAFFRDAGKNAGRSSMLSAAVEEPSEPIRVPMRPLDALLLETGMSRPDLIKIDVEGYEDRVLAPFARNAEDCMLPRAILLETAHRELWREDTVDLIRARGFRVVCATDKNLLLEQRVAN